MAGELVVFVPGIMGSALKYTGPGPLGNRVEEWVWSEDVTDLFFGHGLDRLVYPSPMGSSIIATHVLERLNVNGLKLPGTDLYGTLRQRWISMAENSSRAFLEFPYDWRQSIKASATLLQRQIDSEFARSHFDSLVLIGHSMGGLICRLAMSSPAISARVRLLVQIATPLRGSAKAYWTLQVSPALHDLFDFIVKLIRFKDVFTRASDFTKLMTAIRSLPSIYELLPPHSVKSLVTATGKPCSCVETTSWPEPLRSLVAKARRLHRELDSVAPTRLFVVYGATHTTDNAYKLRGAPPYSFRGDRVRDSVLGDGTVTAESATFGCAPDVLYLEETSPNTHVRICSNVNTLQEIERRIFTSPESVQ